MKLIGENKQDVQEQSFKIEVTGRELLMIFGALWTTSANEAMTAVKSELRIADFNVRNTDEFPHDDIRKIIKDAQ